jgi:hypothetical protein
MPQPNLVQPWSSPTVGSRSCLPTLLSTTMRCLKTSPSCAVWSRSQGVAFSSPIPVTVPPLCLTLVKPKVLIESTTGHHHLSSLTARLVAAWPYKRCHTPAIQHTARPASTSAPPRPSHAATENNLPPSFNIIAGLTLPVSGH